ncbi:MAG TPA: DUF4262 domain-containing protein [Thermoanaerobaculia bacterium]|nr:DUF4262 domain-containing protein [Thermoanaerobaculia bacterium]
MEDDLQALGEATLEKVKRDVETFGWHLLLVSGDADEPAFLFTIGLWESYRHPEIVLFVPSHDPHEMAGNLQVVVERIRQGKTFMPNEVSESLFGHFAGAFRPVAKVWYPLFLGTAMAYYGGDVFPALQLFWPDPDGRYPWEEGFAAALFPFQPLLHESVLNLANLPEQLVEELEDSGSVQNVTFAAEDLFVDLDPETHGDLLDEWRWLVGLGGEVYLITVFGDLFCKTPDGRIWWLDTGLANFAEVADSEDQWVEVVEERGHEWFHAKIRLDLLLRDAHLEEGQVYGWRQPLMLGGEESAENIERVDAVPYIGKMGRLAKTIHDLTPSPEDDKVGFDSF